MSATADKVPTSPGKILVADDEESIRWVLERACAKDGHTVHAVASGREALVALRERAYDVALIDIKMPDVSGLDVLTRAREDRVDTLSTITPSAAGPSSLSTAPASPASFSRASSSATSAAPSRERSSDASASSRRRPAGL